MQVRFYNIGMPPCTAAIASTPVTEAQLQANGPHAENYNPGSAVSESPAHTVVIDKCGTATAAQAASQ